MAISTSPFFPNFFLYLIPYNLYSSLFSLLFSLFSLLSNYHLIRPISSFFSVLAVSLIFLPAVFAYFHLQALYCIDPTLRCAIPVAKATDDPACLVVRLIVKPVLGNSLFVYKLGVLSSQLSPFLLRPTSISLNNSIQLEPRPHLLYDIAEYCLSSEVLAFQLVAP